MLIAGARWELALFFLLCAVVSAAGGGGEGRGGQAGTMATATTMGRGRRGEYALIRDRPREHGCVRGSGDARGLRKGDEIVEVLSLRGGEGEGEGEGERRSELAEVQCLVPDEINSGMSWWKGGGRLRGSRPHEWNQVSALRRTQDLVRFSVLCPHTALGEVVVVVGNTEALGNMDAAKGARLYTTPETFPLWKGAAELPVGDFKYRFAILAAPHCGGLEREREEFPDHVHRRIKVLPPCLDCSVFLSTDLDGTLIGDQAATDHFFMGWGSQFAGRGSHLVYSTGRPLGSVLQLIDNGVIKKPTALVCAEGTEIYWFDNYTSGSKPKLDEEWREKLMCAWKYEALKKAVEKVANEVTLERVGEGVKQVQFHPDTTGQPLIVIAMALEETSKILLSKLDSQARVELGLDFDVVVSSASSGWFVLLLPPGSGKGVASVHVADRLGFPPDRTVVAGDGANDIPLFEPLAIGVKGIIVGGKYDLVEWTRGEGVAEGAYVAGEGYALGVLEGLNHHHKGTGTKTHLAMQGKLPHVPKDS